MSKQIKPIPEEHHSINVDIAVNNAAQVKERAAKLAVQEALS